jgi:hypothetical protein
MTLELDASSPSLARDESTVLVPVESMATFATRLKQLNAKAEEFGLEPIAIRSIDAAVYERRVQRTGRDFDKEHWTLVPLPQGVKSERPIVLYRIHLEYPLIRLGHWAVVGRLEALDDGNLRFCVSTQPEDLNAIRGFAAHPIECEHCKTQRRRTDSYILSDRDGHQYRQVGSTCLQDFTGIDPATALFLAKMHAVVRLAEEDLDDYACSDRVNAIATQSFLADVSFLAAHYGFVSARRAREGGDRPPTYESAAQIHRLLDESQTLRERYAAERPAHLQKAESIREWIRETPPALTFAENAQLLLAREALRLDPQHLAIAAASVARYNHYLDACAGLSRHLGALGERMNTALVIERVILLPDSFRGQRTHLVLLRDRGGNRLTWKTAAASSEVMRGEGRTVEADFTVKRHSEYKGMAQTEVTRLKVLRWIENATENSLRELPDSEPVAQSDEPPALSADETDESGTRDLDRDGEPSP